LGCLRARRHHWWSRESLAVPKKVRVVTMPCKSSVTCPFFLVEVPWCSSSVRVCSWICPRTAFRLYGCKGRDEREGLRPLALAPASNVALMRPSNKHSQGESQ
jgi:hypothetical protein